MPIFQWLLKLLRPLTFQLVYNVLIACTKSLLIQCDSLLPSTYTLPAQSAEEGFLVWLNTGFVVVEQLFQDVYTEIIYIPNLLFDI